MAPPALVPDITIAGRSPTAAEYAASMTLLRDIEAAPFQALRCSTLDDTATRAWIAIHAAGLVRNNEPAGAGIGPFRWLTVSLTARGRRYLETRRGWPHDAKSTEEK